MELLRAFFEVNPQRAAIYWRKMEESKELAIDRSGDFNGMPFVGPSSDEVNELREMLLRKAQNDWELMTLAANIARHKQGDWAVEWIKRTLAEPESAGDIARAVTLAGLLDDSVTAKGIWANELSEPPLGGWIEIVYAHAKQRIERAWDAFNWLDRMFAAETDEQFFAFWRLFAISADYRVIPLAAYRMRQRPDSMNPRHSDFVDFEWIRVVERTQKAKNNMKRTLFATPTGFRWALPWAS
jgi:hypothetical protein